MNTVPQYIKARIPNYERIFPGLPEGFFEQYYCTYGALPPIREGDNVAFLARHFREVERKMRDEAKSYLKQSSPQPSFSPGKFLSDLLMPMTPQEGPPLPKSLGIGWPGFIGRSIDRIATEGPLGPYKTIRDKGIAAELKRELELITGGKYMK